MRFAKRFKKRSAGLTIAEVLISLVLFAGCMAIVGETTRTAMRDAKESKDITQAELLAESLLAKVRLGIIEMEPATDVPVTENRSMTNDTIADTNVISTGALGDHLWLYTLEINDKDDYGLVEIAVTVRQNLDEYQRPVACRLVRWQALEPEEEEEDEQTSESDI